ncbi:MAG TPA: NAD(P)H-hydrate dehydratase [Steroidobacteraceae bacterium]|jgi:NAD(P)H-hydrate epimerase
MSSANLLYSGAQVRALDAFAIEHGTEGYTLMRRAAEAALRALRSRWPTAMRIGIVTGGGNNGGDGYVLGRFAQAAGLEVVVSAVTRPNTLRGDALRAADEFRASGGRILDYDSAQLNVVDVVVDALLGTGLRQPVRPQMAAAIDAINSCDRPVFALDLPSGLDADSGAVQGAAVRAACTISFVALKTGLFLREGPEHVGRLLFDDLEVAPPPGDERFRPLLQRLGEADIARALPRRARESNKGDFGRVLIVGGGPGMPGAVRLAGESCLRAGAGLVTVATAPDNLVAIAAGRPELIVHGVETAAELASLLAPASVVVVGPGLTQGAWARQLLDCLLESGKSLVLDADALNLLAANGRAAPSGAVLTPHPGEAARLLGSSASEIQFDRMAALQALQRKHPGAVIVLKGAGTLVGVEGQVPGLCERGNPAMAAPGMGDVLTGLIAGILAQCRDPWRAACAGVMAHALAGDELARERQRGVLALEVAEALGHWIGR